MRKLEKGVSYNKFGFLHYSHGDNTSDKEYDPKKFWVLREFKYQITFSDGRKSLLKMGLN